MVKILLLFLGSLVAALWPLGRYLSSQPNLALFAIFPFLGGFIPGFFNRSFWLSILFGVAVGFGGSFLISIAGLFSTAFSLYSLGYVLAGIIEHGLLLTLFSLPGAVLGFLVFFSVTHSLPS